jgi:centrin-1
MIQVCTPQIIFFWTLLARQISEFFYEHPEFRPAVMPSIEARKQSPHIGLSQQQEDQIKEIFDLFDTDGSGAMDRRELTMAMFALGFQTVGKDGKAHQQFDETVFNPLDTDCSNTISLDEFKSLMVGEFSLSDPINEIKSVYLGICGIHPSDPGHINLIKLQLATQKYHVRLSDHELVMMMNDVDHDGSQTVDEEEFIRIMGFSPWF